MMSPNRAKQEQCLKCCGMQPKGSHHLSPTCASRSLPCRDIAAVDAQGMCTGLLELSVRTAEGFVNQGRTLLQVSHRMWTSSWVKKGFVPLSTNHSNACCTR